MLFHQLIKQVNWHEVSKAILYSYDVEDLEKYKFFFLDLLTRKSKYSDISILVQKIYHKNSKGGYFAEVSGLETDTEKEEETEHFAIEFSSWPEWLGMNILKQNFQIFSAQEIVAHCMMEMTFFAFHEEDSNIDFWDENSSPEDVLNNDLEYDADFDADETDEAEKYFEFNKSDFFSSDSLEEEAETEIIFDDIFEITPLYQAISDELKKKFFGEEINFLDDLRISFENHEIQIDFRYSNYFPISDDLNYILN